MYGYKNPPPYLVRDELLIGDKIAPAMTYFRSGLPTQLSSAL